jgi:predicted unusual protein kinase regulating ubiquinone biosynthesis (AarF/ABC1/UbiB family)
MPISVNVLTRPQRLGRYAELVRLLVKYGRSDLVRQAGLDPALADEPHGVVDLEAARAEGDELAAELERLGPTFIKLGQLLSTRTDLLPPTYVDALSRLQDELEPFPEQIARETIEEELGVRLSRVFDEFDETPMAACIARPGAPSDPARRPTGRRQGAAAGNPPARTRRPRRARERG